MIRIYKHYKFLKWMKKLRVSDLDLKNAILEIEQGLVDADLGQGVLKKRIAVNGRGKRGGARTIIAFRLDHRAVFIYGFGKNEKETLSPSDEAHLKQLAKIYLKFSEEKMKQAVKIDELMEVI